MVMQDRDTIPPLTNVPGYSDQDAGTTIYLMDIKTYGQVLSFALFATGPFWLLLDGDQHFIFCLLHIKYVLGTKDGR